MSPRGNQLSARLGFPPAAIPIVMLVGLAVLLGTTPSLFGQELGRLQVGSQWASGIRSDLTSLLYQWQTALDSERVHQINQFLLPAAFIAALALILTAGIRAARVRRAEPLAFTVVAFVLGLIALPAVGWFVELVTVVYRVSRTVLHAVGDFLSLIGPTLGWIFLAALGVALVVAIGVVIRWVVLEGRWLLAFWVPGIVGVGVVAGLLGGLNPVRHGFVYLGHLTARYVGHYLAVDVHWIFVGLFVALLTLAVIGGLVAALGQLGRTVILPLKSAATAGSGRGKCVDLAAGVGVTTSVVLCGASLDTGTGSAGAVPFGQTFAAMWHDTVALRWMPNPTSAFSYLLPSAVKHVVAPDFTAYNPVIDCLLLLATASLGALSMLTTSRVWGRSESQRIFWPVLIAVGVAVAAVLPLIVIYLILKYRS